MSTNTIRSSADAAAFYQQHGYAPGAIEALTRSFGDLSVQPRERFLDINYRDLREDQSVSSGDRHFSDTSSFGRARYSDISSNGIREAERINEEYFAPEVEFAPVDEAYTTPSLFDRVAKCLKIGFAALTIGSLLLYPLLLNANKAAAAAGQQHGQLEGMASTRYAVHFVSSLAHGNIAAVWDQFIRSINN